MIAAIPLLTCLPIYFSFYCRPLEQFACTILLPVPSYLYSQQVGALIPSIFSPPPETAWIFLECSLLSDQYLVGEEGTGEKERRGWDVAFRAIKGYWLDYLFVCSSVHLFIHLFVYVLLYLFIHSFCKRQRLASLYVRSFVSISFTYLFMCPFHEEYGLDYLFVCSFIMYFI